MGYDRPSHIWRVGSIWRSPGARSLCLDRQVSDADFRKNVFRSFSSSSGKCSSQTDSNSSLLRFLLAESFGFENTGGVSLKVILAI